MIGKFRLRQVTFVNHDTDDVIRLVSEEDWVVGIFVNDEDLGTMVAPARDVDKWASKVWTVLVNHGVIGEECQKDKSFLEQMLAILD